MKVQRIYIDTSVVGGCEDDEFREASLAFFAGVRKGRFRLLVSDLLLEELAGAPAQVRFHLPRAGRENVFKVLGDDESLELGQRYLDAGVVGPASGNDALHVAIATVARADVVASWNFKHIVHVDKVRGFNAVNLREGYPLIDIRSPLELI
ncbi:MAG: PIN domain protein [Verrucomicrobiota bacterium]